MRRLVERINRALEVGVQVLMAVLTVTVFTQVIFRFLLQQPLSWSEEVGRYVFVWVIWLGTALAVAERGHPGMDFVVGYFSPRWQRLTDIVINLMIAAALTTVAYTGTRLVVGNMSQPSPAMEIPMGIPYAAIPLSAAVMLLNLAYYIFFPKPNGGK